MVFKITCIKFNKGESAQVVASIEAGYLVSCLLCSSHKAFLTQLTPLKFLKQSIALRSENLR